MIVGLLALVVALSGTAIALPGDGGAGKSSAQKLKTNGSLQKVSSSASNADPAVARENADKVPLFGSGPLKVYGKCFTDTTADTTLAEVFVRTKRNGAIFASHEEDELSGDPFLDKDTDEVDRQIETDTAAANATDFESEPTTFYAAVKNTAVQGEVGVAVKNGTLAGGNGVYGGGNTCLFWGHMIVS